MTKKELNERTQFFRIFEALPQNDQEEFIDLLLETTSRAEQRQLIQALSLISTEKSEAKGIDLNLLQSQRPKPNLKLVVNNELPQSRQPQAEWKSTPTVNKVA